MNTLNKLRSLASRPPLDRLLLRPAVRRSAAAVASLRFVPSAWATDRPLSFVAADLRHKGVGSYRLRGSDLTLVMRHDTGARELLSEIFSSGCYGPDPGLLSSIPDAPKVLDIGANVGAFAAYAAMTWPTAEITCIEPDTDNLSALRLFASLNPRLGIRIHEACAATSDGDVPFAAGGGAGSRVQEGGRPMSAMDVLPMIAASGFVKMDIDGSEWPILANSRLAAVGPTTLVMEYHRRFPGDKGAAGEAKRLLTAAEFRVTKLEPNYWGHGLIWGVHD